MELQHFCTKHFDWHSEIYTLVNRSAQPVRIVFTVCI